MKTILPVLKLAYQVTVYTLALCLIVFSYFALFACCDNFLR